MGMKNRIEEKLRTSFDPRHMELVDETHMHNVPPDSESHWKLLVVSECFEGKRSVHRHRAVYGALSAEMSGGIHALSLVVLTPAEWTETGGELPPSPPCLGGSKKES
jgi:BolA protein